MSSDGNRRPSQVLFQSSGDGWIRPVSVETMRAQNFILFQDKILHSRSIGLLEVEVLRSEMQGAGLSVQELAALEQAARTRAVTCEKMNGWHSGFRDMADAVQGLRMARKGEAN
jgi:hypothetical protein